MGEVLGEICTTSGKLFGERFCTREENVMGWSWTVQRDSGLGRRNIHWRSVLTVLHLGL